MGIRFRCPNGHKIHVKTFLAGKAGFCPECQVKVRIPEASDPDLDSAAASFLSSNESSASPSGSGAATVSAQARWYVRPPAGGQYGPASEDAFREWVADGRVAPNAYVWCEGWAEWRLARDVLPQDDAQAETTRPIPKAQPVKPKPARPIESRPEVRPESRSEVRPNTEQPQNEVRAVPLPTVQVDEPTPRVTRIAPNIAIDPAAPSIAERYQRRKSTKTAVGVVVLLSLACLALFVALIYVLR
jgi:hypothetical protein